MQDDSLPTPPQAITQKLGEIAQLTGDGFVFLKLRFSAEHWESQRGADPHADELCRVIEQFHALVRHISSTQLSP